MSKQDDAKKIINEFAAGTKGGNLWKGLRRDKVAAGALVRIDDPDKIAQQEAQVCGPACFVRAVAIDMPEVYARAIAHLFEHGRTTIGRGSKSLYLRPGTDLMNYVLPATAAIDQADWIILASIRDSENFFFDYQTLKAGVRHNVAGITTPGEMVDWFEEAGYTDVHESTNLTAHKDLANAQQASHLFDSNYKVSLLVNDNMLYPSTQDSPSPWPNHWVALTSRMTFALRQGTVPAQQLCDWEGRHRRCMTVPARTDVDLKASTVSLTVYTWGQPHQVPESGTLSLGSFLGNYYGYVACKY